MAESLPPLSEVPPEYERESPPAPPSRALPRWLVVAVVLLGAFCGWLAWQTSRLQSENAALHSEVTTLQGQVEAYRSHLDGARERSSDLRARMDELEAWLARDPAN
jgi:hypothetical protein